MKVIFAGTPEFAVQALLAIIRSGHEVVSVLTQPDRPAGRGMQIQASPVKVLAQEKNIPVLQPLSLNIAASDPAKQLDARTALTQLDQLQFDVIVVVAYGLILPQPFLEMAERNGRLGCFNIHASLLPRWRGAAPIQRAIEAGDIKTGVAIMKMDAGLDTGPVLISEEVDIKSDDTSRCLHDRLAHLGADLIVQALNKIESGCGHELQPQNRDGITYANKILKSEAAIDWHRTALEIDRKVRAFNPFPGATTQFQGEPIKIWKARILSGEFGPLVIERSPGDIIGEGTDGVLVQCRDQCLEVLEVQKAGGKKISARAWFLANPLAQDKQFSGASHKIED
jgi:methionyl-tRNA formyltransferase